METEIVELLKEIRDELKKLTTQVTVQVHAAQGRDYQQEAAQMVNTIMSAITKGMGGNHGQ